MTRSCFTFASTALLLLIAVAPPASADPECIQIRGSGEAQSSAPFSPWEGTVRMRMRGKTYEGSLTWYATDAGLPATPPFHLVTFGKATLDFGAAGVFSTWGLMESAPVDSTYTDWAITGFQCLGTPITDPFIWGGTGMFALATGWLEMEGSMHWVASPPPGDPNTMEIELTGRICGVDWDWDGV